MFKKSNYKFLVSFISSISLCCAQVFAQAEDSALGEVNSKKPSGIYDEILVTGGRENIRTTAGSAAYLDETIIKAFDTTDINSLLEKVPGVYIRQEDGFGLRPNIGLRGTNSDRSSKVTLMEDGILIGPAPYSAPAAYYVPNVNRMSAVEVFKGPSVVQHGPHTVGGAINFVTKPIPVEREGELGLALGSFGYQKVNASYGQTFDQLGFLVDVLNYSSDGFKELEDGGDTGFERNDFNTKWQWTSETSASVYQEFQLKLGYADEKSDETYLGLTDADFKLNPDRRYPASEFDRFSSEHQQIHFLYSADFNNDWVLTAKAYHNTFERSWDKFAGIVRGEFEAYVDASEILLGGHPAHLALIREIEGNPFEGVTRIDVTNNDRQYQSSGLQLNLDYSFDYGDWQHNFSSGLRIHRDSVERDHLGRAYSAEQSEWVLVQGYQDQKTLNTGEVDAYALFLEDKIEVGDYIINLGIRHEDIHSHYNDLMQVGGYADGYQKAWLPGAGIFYQYTASLGFLLGVNYGFSPKAASADVGIDPEFSLNYEYGLRYQEGAFGFELIGFFSDYSNLLGRCRASDACDGEEFEVDEALTQGLELTVDSKFSMNSDWVVPLRLAYTYTDASFGGNFNSDFPQWGDVQDGDRMPYIPLHQFSLESGVTKNRASLVAAVKYISEMNEASGTGVPLSGLQTQELLTLDFSFKYEISQGLAVQVIAQNLSDERRIVSRRPYGARPNAPRMIKAGVSYRF